MSTFGYSLITKNKMKLNAGFQLVSGLLVSNFVAFVQILEITLNKNSMPCNTQMMVIWCLRQQWETQICNFEKEQSVLFFLFFFFFFDDDNDDDDFFPLFQCTFYNG